MAAKEFPASARLIAMRVKTTLVARNATAMSEHDRIRYFRRWNYRGAAQEKFRQGSETECRLHGRSFPTSADSFSFLLQVA
jgi:hypothetical protein